MIFSLLLCSTVHSRPLSLHGKFSPEEGFDWRKNYKILTTVWQQYHLPYHKGGSLYCGTDILFAPQGRLGILSGCSAGMQQFMIVAMAPASVLPCVA
jgi:hypothetical protein